MSKEHVLITGALHERAVQAFRSSSNLEVNYSPDLSREILLKSLDDVSVLVTRSETRVDAEVIDAAPKLRVIARAAVGVGNIDVDYATDKGILVINCPGKNTNSAAELTIGLIICMLRNIPSAYQNLKGGGWDRHRFAGFELRGKKIGLVGLGNVGHRVARFAKNFEMDVFAYDPYIAPDVFGQYGAVAVGGLQPLAEMVDVLSVHVPLNNETRGFVTKEVIDSMAEGSYLVNCARGGVVDENVVLAALDSNHLAGYAVDTFADEPTSNSALVEHAKVWGTPHIGASTEEAQRAIGETVYQQVVKAIDGGVVDYPVNLPEVGLPDNELLKSYAVLAQKLGSVIGQIIDFNPQKFEIFYRGDIAEFDTSFVRLGLMKGYAAHVVDEYVSFVNTSMHFEKLGIKLSESKDPQFSSYKSALKVVVSGAGGKRLTIGGIVFDDRLIRISLLNGFAFEAEPAGSLLVVENLDRPGVIGDVGQYLALQKINIDNFTLSRKEKGGQALAMIRVDEPVSKGVLGGLKEIKHVLNAKAVNL